MTSRNCDTAAAESDICPTLPIRRVGCRVLLAACVTAMLACGNRGNESPAPDIERTVHESGQVIRVGLSKQPADAGRVLPKVGFNVNWLTLPGDAQTIADTVADFRPDLIRYPGGSVGDIWDWRAGWVDTSALEGHYRQWARYRRSPYPLDSIGRLVNRMGARPIFALNALTDSVESQLSLLRRARELGLDVQFVELGNEYYYRVPEYERTYFSGQAYGRRMERWMSTIGASLPEARMAIIGSESRDELAARRREWIDQVFDVLSVRPPVAIHPYIGVTEDLVHPSLDVSQFLSLPFRKLAELEKGVFDKLRTDDEIWFTEYNISGSVREPIEGTWLHSLAVATYTLLLMEDPRVEVLLFHEITGPSRINRAVEAPPWSDEVATSSTGLGLKLLFRAISRHDRGKRIYFSPSPMIVATGREGTRYGDRMQYPALVAWQFGGEETVVLNLAPDSSNVALGDWLTTDRPRVRSFTVPDVKEKIFFGRSVESSTTVASDSLRLPPHSISVLGPASSSERRP